MTISVTYWVIKLTQTSPKENYATGWITCDREGWVTVQDKEDAMPFLTEKHAELVMNELKNSSNKEGLKWSLQTMRQRDIKMEGF